MDALEFTMIKLQEQVNALRHMNIVVSQMPIHILQDLQIGLLQEIKIRGDEAHHEMTKIMDERAQLQQNMTLRSNRRGKLKVRVE
jgi:hypothetical protein